MDASRLDLARFAHDMDGLAAIKFHGDHDQEDHGNRAGTATAERSAPGHRKQPPDRAEHRPKQRRPVLEKSAGPRVGYEAFGQPKVGFPKIEVVWDGDEEDERDEAGPRFKINPKPPETEVDTEHPGLIKRARAAIGLNEGDWPTYAPQPR